MNSVYKVASRSRCRVYKVGRVLVVQVNKWAARAAGHSAGMTMRAARAATIGSWRSAVHHLRYARHHPSSHSTAWSTILGVRW